jgi:hypothetical protein
MRKIAVLLAIAFIGTNVYAADQKTATAAAPVKTAAPATQAKAVTAPTAKTATPAATQAAPATPQKPLTKAEKIDRIKQLLTNRPNVVPSIQGLEAVKQADGSFVYMYNKKKIEDLDDDTLLKLLSMINQQISIENIQQFERQQRQLRNLQQIEQMNKTQRALRQTQTATTPKVYTPPKVPKTYK